MKQMTPDEYRALLRETRAQQCNVTSEEARRQYLEFHGSHGQALLGKLLSGPSKISQLAENDQEPG